MKKQKSHEGTKVNNIFLFSFNLIKKTDLKIVFKNIKIG